MIDILNHQSGGLGISGVSGEMRDVEVGAEKGNKRCQLALEINDNRVVKYIGQYLAELQGADAIVFTAGVGENDERFRQSVADKLAYFGVAIDPKKNDVRGVERDLSTPDAKIKTLLIPTNEELMIVHDILRLKKQADAK